MNPTQSDVHVNGPLSQILVAYLQDQEKAVGPRAFPVIGVDKKTDTYYKWTRADFYRIQAAERAPGTPSEGGDFNVSTDTFECKEYAIHKDVPDAIRANADSELHFDEAATRYVGHQLMLKREKLFLDTFFVSTPWSAYTAQTGVSGTPSTNQFKQWNDATSTPIEVVRDRCLAIEAATGYRPNKLIMGPAVWNELIDHPDIIDRIKYTQTGIVSRALVASLLELDEILVPGLVYNSAAEGATESNAFMAGKSALLLYAPPTPSLMEPSAGYTFAWTGRPGAGPQGERIKKFRMEDIESDRIEGQMNMAFKVVAADLGQWFASVVA